MSNTEKIYATDWKFFKNYTIYVNERNTKVEEDKYEKKCYIGLLDQSQKRLNLLSSRIAKSLYTLGIHNSHLGAIDKDFLNKYIKLDKTISEYKSYKLNVTSGFKIEDKRISFLIYIMASFFHINNLHNNLSTTNEDFDFNKNKDYNIHQLYIDDLFLYILLKAIQLIKTSSVSHSNFINELIKEYNLVLNYYCERLNNLHLIDTDENFIKLFNHNSYLYSSISNVQNSIFTKNISLDYENNIDIKEYYSNFTDTDILFMLRIVCDLFKNNFQVDNYKKNTFETVKDDYSYVHLKNKFYIKVDNINNTFANISKKIDSHIQKDTIEDNSEIDTVVVTLKCLEEIKYCSFLLKNLRLELNNFFPINIKYDTRTELNLLLEHIRNSINSLNASSRTLNILLLTENSNSRRKLNTKLDLSIQTASSHIESISRKLELLYTKPNIPTDLSIKSIRKSLSKEKITTDILSMLQNKLKKKLKDSNNTTTTLLSFIELFNLEQYSIFDSLVIINPEIESIYLDLIDDIDKESIKEYLGLFPFIKSIL